MTQMVNCLHLSIETDAKSDFLEQLELLCKTHAISPYRIKTLESVILEDDSEQKFIRLIKDFLGIEILEVEVFGSFEITLNLKDVNHRVGIVEWENSLKEYLNKENIKVRFSYGDEGWVTIKQIF